MWLYSISRLSAGTVWHLWTVQLLVYFTQGVDDYLYGRGGNSTGFSWTDPVACSVPKVSEALCLDSVHFEV
jgi:hypothetical protein